MHKTFDGVPLTWRYLDCVSSALRIVSSSSSSRDGFWKLDWLCDVFSNEVMPILMERCAPGNDDNADCECKFG